jgi:phosphatidate cytidylyltransferase
MAHGSRTAHSGRNRHGTDRLQATSSRVLRLEPAHTIRREVGIEALSQPLAAYTALAALSVVLFGLFLRITRLTAGWLPYRTWLVMLPPVLVALWLGVWAWAFLITMLSIYGFKEFARATGLYRERLFVLTVYLAMVAANALAYFGRFGLFMVVPMWGVALLTLVPIVQNKTEGMLQGFALSVLGVVYFGWFLAHLTYLATWDAGLGLVLYVVLATQLNDVVAFLFGKLFGRRHWTALSPNKTVAGSLGALVFGIIFAFVNWQLAFPQLPWWGVLGLGAIVGAGGQIGDLTLANFKRNVGIKDFGNLLPGHGGILDRLNSLTLVAPLALHFVRFFFGGFP